MGWRLATEGLSHGPQSSPCAGSVALGAAIVAAVAQAFAAVLPEVGLRGLLAVARVLLAVGLWTRAVGLGNGAAFRAVAGCVALLVAVRVLVAATVCVYTCVCNHVSSS